MQAVISNIISFPRWSKTAFMLSQRTFRIVVVAFFGTIKCRTTILNLYSLYKNVSTGFALPFLWWISFAPAFL
jgi:hypothetical protein